MQERQAAVTDWREKAKPIRPGDAVGFTALYLPNAGKPARRGKVVRLEHVCDPTMAVVDFEDGTPVGRINVNALERLKRRGR